jgi:hypothetical protein
LLDAHAPEHVAAGRPAGYLGFVGPWLDFDLLERVASAVPETILHLVGPVAASETARLRCFLSHPNARYSDSVAEREVAGVLSRFAVGMIPFRLTPLTNAVNPNKLYEYAAFDLPIVATPFSAEVRDLAGTIDVCRTPDEFAAAIRLRTSEPKPAGTRPIAEAHLWTDIGEQFAGIIEGAAKQAVAG